MRIVLKIFLLIMIAFCFSCEKQGLFVKCSECTETEPLRADMEIKLDLNYYGMNTIINIYEGNLEDSVLYRRLETDGSSMAVSVTINKKYTVTATYYVPPNYYIAVDSATPRVVYNKDQCDNPCYFIYDKAVNLKLKYTK